MSTAKINHEVRRCALQAMFQFDLSGTAESELVRRSLDESAGTPDDHARGYDLATLAWEFRLEADAAFRPLAKEWPTHRQPPIDRNLLRLAYYEIFHGSMPAKIAINEAVELAKEFGSEKSPSFVNALLDRLWKSRAPKSTAANPSEAKSDAASDASGSA
ncbi:MAG: transcription antitermination factor NusB [Phycisphaerales bacterium]